MRLGATLVLLAAFSSSLQAAPVVVSARPVIVARPVVTAPKATPVAKPSVAPKVSSTSDSAIATSSAASWSLWGFLTGQDTDKKEDKK